MDLRILKEKIVHTESIYIYGAGVVAYGIYKALYETYGVSPRAFLVSERNQNEREIEQIPVLGIGEAYPRCSKSLVIVATPEIYHKSIRQTLSDYKIYETVFVDSHLEFVIMSEYYKIRGGFMILDTNDNKQKLLAETSCDIKIYMAKSHFDKALESKVDIPEWVIPIQVGKVLTEQKIAEISDDMGENISIKNRDYSELTATYWVWKNVKSDYKGICHYRRQLLFTEEDLVWIKENDIDVVLPLPFVCYPNAKGQYGRYILKEDQDILFQALKEQSEEYAKAAEMILQQPYLYNYNMLLAKEMVYDAYCEWMFPILFRAEEIRVEKKGCLNDRFAGYFGEILTALYFLKNKDKYKIVHAEKKWFI